MDSCFSGNKEGRAAAERYENTIVTLVDEEYQKQCIKPFSARAIGKTDIEIELYNRALKNSIEKAIRDKMER